MDASASEPGRVPRRASRFGAFVVAVSVLLAAAASSAHGARARPQPVRSRASARSTRRRTARWAARRAAPHPAPVAPIKLSPPKKRVSVPTTLFYVRGNDAYGCSEILFVQIKLQPGIKRYESVVYSLIGLRHPLVGRPFDSAQSRPYRPRRLQRHSSAVGRLRPGRLGRQTARSRRRRRARQQISIRRPDPQRLPRHVQRGRDRVRRRQGELRPERGAARLDAALCFDARRRGTALGLDAVADGNRPRPRSLPAHRGVLLPQPPKHGICSYLINVSTKHTYAHAARYWSNS